MSAAVESDWDGGWIPLSRADTGEAEGQVLAGALGRQELGTTDMVEAFETAFAGRLGRDKAISAASGQMALLMALTAKGIGPGDEVICSPYGWHNIATAIALAGATPVFADIDYWAHTLNPKKAREKITDRTVALMAGNTNGHPAAWDELRAIADDHGLWLIEDSTEAIGSTFRDRPVGCFGDIAVFDFSLPSPLYTGTGGMVVTDDADFAHRIRYLRRREIEHRYSLVITGLLPWDAPMGELNAALGLIQLRRLDAILAQRDRVRALYEAHMQTFEGIKPPYAAPGVTRIDWFLYAVHLGTRFSQSSRNAVLEDLRAQEIEASDFTAPLHLQQAFIDRGWRRGDLPVTEKVADRAVVLPFHADLDGDAVDHVVKILKDASINSGAGAAIYL